MIEIKKGYVYKTEFGGKVHIAHEDKFGNYPFLGTVEIYDSTYREKALTKHPVSFDRYGKASRSVHGFDIISEWTSQDQTQSIGFGEDNFEGSPLDKEIRNYSQERIAEQILTINRILRKKQSKFWEDALVKLKSSLK